MTWSIAGSIPSSVRASFAAASSALHLAQPVPSTFTDAPAVLAASAFSIVSLSQAPPQQQPPFWGASLGSPQSPPQQHSFFLGSSFFLPNRDMAEEKLALVLGTEGTGLAQSTIAACDYTARIPMQHGVDSLNVAAASAVAFWQLRAK